MSGTLYLCGTPIGNLEDITFRAVSVLKSCHMIAAEDTRHTRILLERYDIHTPMSSYHEHNRAEKGPYFIGLLLEGKDVALVTDAGMPGISDPGQDLVRLCRSHQIPVTVVPGPTAGVTALVLSGLDSRRFLFEGFLPTEKKEQTAVLESLKEETRTAVFYEAPHRLAATLETFYRTLGNRQCACVRELTKKFEEVKLDSLENLCQYYKETQPKGEFVVILAGVSKEELLERKQQALAEVSIEAHMERYLAQGMSQKDAMKAVAKDRGVSKREIYQYLNR